MSTRRTRPDRGSGAEARRPRGEARCRCGTGEAGRLPAAASAAPAKPGLWARIKGMFGGS